MIPCVSILVANWAVVATTRHTQHDFLIRVLLCNRLLIYNSYAGHTFARFVARPAALSVRPGEVSGIATCISGGLDTVYIDGRSNGGCVVCLLNVQIDGGGGRLLRGGTCQQLVEEAEGQRVALLAALETATGLLLAVDE